MIYYLFLLLAFLYFKIARVYYKEESKSKAMFVQNIAVAFAIFLLLLYGFIYKTWYMVLLMGYIFFIVAALIVSAVQLGIFVDGRPIVKISHLHKSLAFIGMVISFYDVNLWVH